MTMTPAQIEALLAANAAALDLRIAAEHRAGVLQYLALAAAMAEQVQGLALTPHDEPAAVFVPVAPRGSAP